ncbi:MAG: hypothetical protein ACJAYU_005061 [Bradymonadia bacterium]|jgi:hypothetical protein
MRLLIISLTLGALTAACGDARTVATPVDEIWGSEPVRITADEAIEFADREAGAIYGLPRDGMASVADLIAVFPEDGQGGGDPNIFIGPNVTIPTDQCRGGAPVVVPELPMTIEAVVTLHPRQYMKVEICGQDERHYGVYTVEDDTGGIIVLRDSRVAPYTFGDRVRLTVDAVTLTFNSDADTRAILVAAVERIPEETGQDVLYRNATEPFTTEYVGQVKQVEGFVHVEPTNLNFNSMVMTSELVSRRQRGEDFTGELLQCVRTCEVQCLTRCPSTEACADICPDACVSEGGVSVPAADLPVCWLIGIDAELGRRGFQPAYGTELQVRGPVVNNFDVQMWVISPGQVEEL